MALGKKVAEDFDEIIQSGRKRKQNEDLAKEVFGRNRNRDNKKKDDKRAGRPATPTLASRVGITKRSSSTSSNTASPKLQSRPRSSLPGQNARVNRIATQINDETSANLLPASTSVQSTVSTVATPSANTGTGISIKGASGPFVLHASNFAPGTTAADIESALHPDTLWNDATCLVSCKIVRTKPDVVAELVFTEKIVAENIIAKYNGQKADGRILQVELVRSGFGALSKDRGQSQQSQSQSQSQSNTQQQDRQDRQNKQHQNHPQESEAEEESEIEIVVKDAMEDVEMNSEPQSQTMFSNDRAVADQGRREREAGRNRDDHYNATSSNNNNRRQDDRERDRDRQRDRKEDRDREADRNGGRDSDTKYERREDRPREDRIGTMPSHYGNGVGGMSRGGTGLGGGYGMGGPTMGGGYRGGRYGEGYTGGRGNYRGYRGYR